MNKNLFSICGFLFLLLSCGEKTTTGSDQDYPDSIFVTDSVSIPISADEYFRSIQNHIIEYDQEPFLLRESRMKSSIEVYDWTEKQKVKRISYQAEGPNTIRSFGSAALYPFSIDSILIANLVGDIYYTEKDSVLESWSNEQGFRFYGESSYKPARIGRQIFMHSASNYRQEHPGFYENFGIVGYDLDKKEFFSIPVEYPERFREHCWTQQHWDIPFTANDDGQLVLSFSVDPVIKIYDPSTEAVIATHNVQSKFAGAVEPLPGCEVSDEEYFRHLKSTPRYLSLTYDSIKKVYYRMIALPVPGIPDGQRNFDQVQPFSIMILDEDFGVIAEKAFPAQKYDNRDFFVTEEGLWLSRNNEDAADFDENRIFYDLIGFDKGV